VQVVVRTPCTRYIATSLIASTCPTVLLLVLGNCGAIAA
jgi:hypothetical protein